MLSKRISIENTDLTSGELLTDIHITQTYTASNNTRTEVWYPTEASCFNNSGKTVVLVFLSSGELSDYQADVTNRDGIVVPDQQSFVLPLAPNSMYLNVVADDTLSAKLEISVFNYQKLYA